MARMSSKDNPLTSGQAGMLGLIAVFSLGAAAYFAYQCSQDKKKFKAEGVAPNATGTVTTLPTGTLFIDNPTSGTTANAGIGQMILVSLPENPSTGYSWSTSSSGYNKSYMANHPRDATTGGGGVASFSYITQNPNVSALDQGATFTLTAPDRTVSDSRDVHVVVQAER